MLTLQRQHLHVNSRISVPPQAAHHPLGYLSSCLYTIIWQYSTHISHVSQKIMFSKGAPFMKQQRINENTPLSSPTNYNPVLGNHISARIGYLLESGDTIISTVFAIFFLAATL